jgi:large subunit ribosomal protein L21
VAEEGKKINFDEVLLTATDKTVTLGTPLLKGAKVEAKVVRHGRHDKVWGVKMKPKKRQRRLFGHKQHYTEVEITKVTTK